MSSSTSPTESAPLQLKKSVVLVGIMGVGKSSIGRRLAKNLNVPFQDSDEVITEAAACSISDIFEVYGEPMFRDLEKRVILRLVADDKPSIIATGGGAFVNGEVRDIIKKHAISVWLDADIDVIVDRVSRRKNRPLLEKSPDKRATLATLIAERTPYYQQADIHISSDQGAHENVVARILDALAAYPSTQNTAG